MFFFFVFFLQHPISIEIESMMTCTLHPFPFKSTSSCSLDQQIRPTSNKDYLGKKQINNSVSLSHISSYETGRHRAQTNLTHLFFELREKSLSSYFQLNMFSSWLEACYLCIQIQQKRKKDFNDIISASPSVSRFGNLDLKQCSRLISQNCPI